ICRMLVGTDALLAIGPSEALLPQNGAIARHGHGDRGRARFHHLLADKSADRVELVRVKGEGGQQETEQTTWEEHSDILCWRSIGGLKMLRLMDALSLNL